MAKQDMSEEEAGMMPDGIDDNLLSEILLRLPPLPSSLPRASAVCRRWYGLASDPCFCRRFRRRHRRNAPLLGLFNTYHKFLPFVPTLDAPNSVLPARFSLPLLIRAGEYLDCEARHGLLLFFDEDEEHPHFLVWDPVTGDQTRLEMPPGFEEPTSVRGAVLRDAGDVHFRVVVAVGDNEDSQQRRVLALVYSSETNLWGDLISKPLPPDGYVMSYPAVLVGDSLYWQISGSFTGILEFNLERQSLDVIRVPVHRIFGCFSVIREEDGGMGFLSVSGFTAQLWKWKTDSDGIESWVLGRTIELDKLLSLDPKEHEHILVLGYAEENNMVFLSTAVGLFMVQLQSLQFTFMKHTETTDIDSCHPFESVYTAETRNKGPEEFDLSEQYIGWPE